MLVDLRGFPTTERSQCPCHTLTHTQFIAFCCLSSFEFSNFNFSLSYCFCLVIKFPSFISRCTHIHNTKYYPIHLYSRCKIPIRTGEHQRKVKIKEPKSTKNKKTKRILRTHAHTDSKKDKEEEVGNFESEVFQIRFFCGGADGVFLLLFSLLTSACLHNCCFAFFTFSRTQMHHTPLNVWKRACVCVCVFASLRVFSVCLLLHIWFDILAKQTHNTMQ